MDLLTQKGSKMKCSTCQFENRDGAKFCKKCGNKLETVCPSCGHPYQFDSAFCDECGYNFAIPSGPSLKDLSFDEKLTKIQRYLPKGLTEKILAQKDKIEGERKQVTVMFCDMQGFTALSEQLGLEQAYGFMDRIYEILIHKVHDYEGTVNEMTGDGIMALFGAPIALEDAPQRAIRSSLAIHREMAKFSDGLKGDRDGTPPLKMRVGIHTGPVLVGTLGNDLRVEFKAVGDTVNLASRMEGLAAPGATYVTGETFRLTEGLFRFEALGKKEVKGKQEPVNIYRVIAPSTRRTRFDVSTERGLTPFVGRDRELELLLDGFERSKTSRGQAFSIVSDAGVGKSRLLYEFRKAVASEDVTFLEGKSLSYSRSIAYHPWIDILKSNFDIGEGDGDLEIREKIKKGLKILGSDEALTLPYLLELLSVKESGIDNISLSPEVRKNRIIEALKRISLKGSEIRPLIMAFEDLHWLDKSSEEALKFLLDNISGARVFLIFTYRPEFVHTWGGKSYHNQVNLNRLSNRESLTVVTHILGTEVIDSDLEELILEKTEGVPFFIEEFIKSLKDLNIIEKKDNQCRLAKDIKEVAIPSTIQDVTMARVDTLPEAAKEVLQTGSVIEREFSHELIKQVSDFEEQELLSHLSVLKDSELLYERGIFPQSVYIFKHNMTQEVVYNSLLLKKRKQIHEKIAHSLEALYAKRLEEFYEMLAYHYSRSEDPEKAYHYLRLSGSKATRNYSNWEAFRFYKEAIDVLSKMPEAEQNKREQIKVRLSMAVPMNLLGYPEDSLKIFEEGERLSKELGDEKSLARFLGLMGIYYILKGGDLLLGVKYCEDSFKEAEKIGDVELMASISIDLFIVYFMLGEFFKIIEMTSKLIALLDKTQRQSESFGKPWNIYSVLHAGYGSAKCMLGNFEEGEVLFEKGLDFALEIENLQSLSFIEFLYGMMQNRKGDGKNAIAHLQNAIRYAEEGQNVAYLGPSWIGLGWGYCLLGENQTARKHMEKGLKIHSDVGLGYHMGFYYGLFSIVHFNSGLWAEKALKISQKNHEKWAEGFVGTLLGRILGKSGAPHVDQAEECIVKGIRILEGLKAKQGYSVGYFLLGELYADTGQRHKALENLKKAKKRFEEMGMDHWLEKTNEILGRL
jgi:class 3 adenylate cyclase/tetratricopeptide (TPR) repeat protein